MNTTSSDCRRGLVYVDHKLQTGLLIALVVLETALTAFAIWGLYKVLGEIIDDNLYRVHLSRDGSMLRRFLIEGAMVLAITGVVNLAAIIVADRIWAFYVRGILRRLDQLMHAAQRLDLMPQRDVKRTHAVLDQALRWQRSESLRLRRIRHAVRHLPEQLPMDTKERKALAAQLRVIQDRGAHGPEL